MSNKIKEDEDWDGYYEEDVPSRPQTDGTPNPETLTPTSGKWILGTAPPDSHIMGVCVLDEDRTPIVNLLGGKGRTPREVVANGELISMAGTAANAARDRGFSPIWTIGAVPALLDALEVEGRAVVPFLREAAERLNDPEYSPELRQMAEDLYNALSIARGEGPVDSSFQTNQYDK